VPKLAATLASLLLIASSIGVNIARYPQVGRMIDPGQAEVAESASTVVETSSVPAAEAAHVGPAPARPGTNSPPQVSQDMGTSTSAPSERKIAEPTSSTPLPQAEVAIPIVDVRPMVPVAGLQAGGDDIPSRNAIRRLPPVENSDSVKAETDGNLTNSGIAYPTTSTPW
jgi:hypothetical protein